MKINYQVTSFSETREVGIDVSPSVIVSDEPYSTSSYGVNSLIISYSREAGSSWKVSSVFARGGTMSSSLPLSSLPTWIDELVDSFHPRPIGISALAPDAWSGDK